MASFSAELRVDGHAFALTRCAFGVEQATNQRGRVNTKVRYLPVQLVLAVPNGEVLLGWAAEPHKRLPADILFRDADGGVVLETLRLPAAYCVRYHEQFVSGDAQGGAYQCFLTLSDPDGWTLTAGSPAVAFVAPAARDHGVPGALAGTAAETLRPVVATGLEIGMAEALSRGAANRSAFHSSDPLPLTSPNHLHGQSTGFTCVASCLRMVLADKGLSYGENALAEALDTSSFGASIMHIPAALGKLQLSDQVPTALLNNASFAELAAAMGQGGQAVVSVTIPGLGAHALVVEEITGTHVHIRDPLPLDEGSTYKVKISDFETYWNKRATIIHA